jgi:hypothetical protein
MAVHPEATQYTFKLLDERRVHEYFDRAGIAGLRALRSAVQGDLDALERLVDAIEGGECYSVGPDRVHAWWGWG